MCVSVGLYRFNLLHFMLFLVLVSYLFSMYEFHLLENFLRELSLMATSGVHFYLRCIHIMQSND